MKPPLLEVRNLKVSFPHFIAIHNISLEVQEGEIVGLVGESGSGKSLTALSILKLIPSAQISGEILLNGISLNAKSEKEMQKVRGKRVGLIFQDPMTSFNPTMTVGEQIIEGLLWHDKVSRKEAQEKLFYLLDRVGISDPKRRSKQYPHEFSGGMRQRAMVAMVLAPDPDLIIADEPTTSLDATTQAQVLDLLKSIEKSILLITHDLSLVATTCQRVTIVKDGRVVESGTTQKVFTSPSHEYTQRLLHGF